MNNKFRISICSDLDYEEMVADIYYKNHPVGMVTQENGIDKMEIEILPPDDSNTWNSLLMILLKLFILQKKCLIRMQKLPEEKAE